MVDFENSSSAMAVSATSNECSSGGNQPQPRAEIQPMKKKRNLPGMPDPDAEVIALSPTTLLATNRFVCEICNKGFQRDQNLQLHRRGHNLPWKLKQRDGKEIRKRVYVCPEKTCVHHDPSRALGDLTGIKKHFSRKHGEKKWKCERCSKKYAVQSDCKAHMKTCGTKEYRCDCGTLFSRRDSFITHRAFCDALAQESASSPTQNVQNVPNINSDHQTHVVEAEKVDAAVISPPPSCSPPPPPFTPSTGVLSPVQSVLSLDLPEKAMGVLQHQKVAVVEMEPPTETCLPSATATTTVSGSSTTSGSNNNNNNNNNPTNSTGVFASIFASSSLLPSSQLSPATYSNLICDVTGADRNTTVEPMSLSLSSSLYHSTTTPSLFPPPDQTLQHHHHHHHHRQYVHTQQPALSATALLQKAAQMGATSSNTSFLHALGLAPTPSPAPASSTDRYQEASMGQWSNVQAKQERNCNSDHLLMGPPAPSPTTLDFLGLGTGSSSGYSAFLNTIGGSRLNVAGVQFEGLNTGHDSDWDDSGDKKPTLL